MAEGAPLLRVYRFTPIEGSNPSLSAINQKGHPDGVAIFVCLARLARFERATAWFVARYSIQLSYRRVEGRYYREEIFCSQGLMDG